MILQFKCAVVEAQCDMLPLNSMEQRRADANVQEQLGSSCPNDSLTKSSSEVNPALFRTILKKKQMIKHLHRLGLRDTSGNLSH